MKTLNETASYNKPLILVFVDYEKAIDSIKHEFFNYSTTYLYQNATASVRLHDSIVRVRLTLAAFGRT